MTIVESERDGRMAEVELSDVRAIGDGRTPGRGPLAPRPIIRILDAVLHAHTSTVLSVRSLTPTIISVRLERPERYTYKAGQFALVRVASAEGPDFRPLSIASAPHEEYLEFSTRLGLSAFKRTLTALHPGDAVKVLHPLGSLSLDSKRPAILIAGGIGITPVRSLLVSGLSGSFDQPVRLIYSNRTVDEIAYRNELQALKGQHPRLEITWVLSDRVPSPSIRGAHLGRIDEDLLRRHAAELPDSNFYLTGPALMVADIARLLREIGIPAPDPCFEAKPSDRSRTARASRRGPVQKSCVTTRRKELIMLKRVEMDEYVSLMDQLASNEAPVVLVNTFKVAPEEVDALLEAWTADAQYLKGKPGFVSTQLHRGIAGSYTFLNYAVWESVATFRAAFTDPAFQATFAKYPDSTVASPHLFHKLEIPGLSEA